MLARSTWARLLAPPQGETACAMETGEIAATHEEEHAPLTLWAALVFAAVLPIYLVAPGGDVAKTPIISTLFLVLIAFFLVVRRSRIAWWLLMINLVLRLLADATSGGAIPECCGRP